MVQTVIEGGPSEKVGIMIGDKIVRIDGIDATGDSATNDFVFRHLRGKKGTSVEVDIDRQGTVYSFHIVRDKIPIYSIDSYFMADENIGYIRLIRFARSSADEFRKALKALKKQGMQSLILDLRGNSGGYLDIACQLGNELLDRGQLIVYQEGRRTQRQNFHANGRGNFTTGRLVVLIDEGSASASEMPLSRANFARPSVISHRSPNARALARALRARAARRRSSAAVISASTRRYFAHHAAASASTATSAGLIPGRATAWDAAGLPDMVEARPPADFAAGFTRTFVLFLLFFTDMADSFSLDAA